MDKEDAWNKAQSCGNTPQVRHVGPPRDGPRRIDVLEVTALRMGGGLKPYERVIGKPLEPRVLCVRSL